MKPWPRPWVKHGKASYSCLKEEGNFLCWPLNFLKMLWRFVFKNKTKTSSFSHYNKWITFLAILMCKLTCKLSQKIVSSQKYAQIFWMLKHRTVGLHCSVVPWNSTCSGNTGLCSGCSTSDGLGNQYPHGKPGQSSWLLASFAQLGPLWPCVEWTYLYIPLFSVFPYL